MNKILVVDDDQDLVTLLEKQLQSSGYTSSHCYQGRRAPSVAKEFGPDLIILDVMLGDDLGFHVSRDIRRDKALYKTPILFHSSADEIHDVEHALNQGGDGYLTKPYSRDKLDGQLDSMRRLWNAINTTCPDTHLPSLEALRKFLDHLIFRDEEFACVYIHVAGLRALHKARSSEKIKVATERTARLLKKTIQFDGFYESTTFHLGGGYFMVVTDPSNVVRLVNCLRARFAYEGVDALSSASIPVPVKKSTGEKKNTVRDGRSALAVGSVHRKPGSTSGASSIIERLRHIDSDDEKRHKRASKPAGH